MRGATFDKYVQCLLTFVQAVNATITSFFKETFAVLNDQLLAYLAGQHAVELPNSEVRVFSATMKFFLPFCPKERISAELKGVEKSTPKTPTTPLTLPILIALAFYVKVKCGVAQACGIIVHVGFFGMFRSAELIEIKGRDFILRNRFAKASTIR